MCSFVDDNNSTALPKSKKLFDPLTCLIIESRIAARDSSTNAEDLANSQHASDYSIKVFLSKILPSSICTSFNICSAFDATDKLFSLTNFKTSLNN